MINKGSIMSTTIDDLTERVAIVYQTTVINSRGNVIRNEDTERCEVWAKVLPLTARNTLGGTERESEITYRVIIRYRTDVLPNDEIIWRGKRLTLQSPPYDGESRRKWLVMDCKEALPYGEA